MTRRMYIWRWCLQCVCDVWKSAIFLSVVSITVPLLLLQPDFAQAENFTVGYLTTMTGRRTNKEGLKISGAMSYVIEMINNDSSILKDHKLHFIYNDTGGEVLVSTRATVELWNKGAIAIFGPEDSCEIEAAVAASLELPMLSYKCADSKVSNKNFYKTFARTYPPDKGVVRSILVLLKTFHWYKFSIISENSETYEIVAKSLEAQALVNNLTINHGGIKFFTPNTLCCEDAQPCCNTVYRTIIDETYKRTRVYVFVMKITEMIHMLLMMQMKKLLDKGEYIIIYVDLEQYSESNSYKYMWRMDFKENELRVAFNAARSLLVVVPSPPQDGYEEFSQKVREYSEMPPFNFPNKLPFPRHISEFAAYLYDSVMLYAEALNATLAAKENPRNGTIIIKRIISKNRYKSVTGSWIQIDENGDVEGNYTVLSIQPRPKNLTLKGIKNITINEVMLPVANFQPFDETKDSKEMRFVRLPGMSINWVGGSPPPDEPPCGFDGSLCLPAETFREILAVVLACIFVAVSLVTWVLYKNWKYEQEIAGLLWKITEDEFQRYGSVGLVSVNSRTSVVSQMSLESKVMGQVFTHTVMYKGTLVAAKPLKFNKKIGDIPRETKKEMKIMREMHHDNINQFIGACLQQNSIIIVTEYCAKGSLQDILENDVIKLDHMFIASLVFDLIKGMIFLHQSDLKVHGNLKSSNCVVTSRWVLQVTDFGLHHIYRLSEPQDHSLDYKYYKNLLWKAPELLRHPDQYPKGSQKGDVYAFAIILHEIFLRQGPFGDCPHQPKEIVENVKAGPVLRSDEIFRPPLNGFVGQDYIRQTMIDSWAERPENRPDFRYIRAKLHKMKQGMKSNIMDNMMSIMEKYANNLEDLVDERTMQLAEEQRKTEALLHRMLPKPVAEQLIIGEAVIPESFDAVTIYFSDIVGFTEMSASSTPMEVVTFLNDLYTVFDSIIGHYDVYKVETIGDAYMVVSGLPIRNDSHAGHIASMSLELLEEVKSFKIQHRPNQTLKLRIGIHTGPVVAGVVGLTMPRYCLFGDTVNTASRMESHGEALKIHISDQCKRYLDGLGGYETEERGYVKMKGKGEMKTYWLLARTCAEAGKLQTKEHPVPPQRFSAREAENRRRSPKLEGSRMTIRRDSVQFRNADDLMTSVPNGSVPGIPAFFRMSQESPRAPKRFSPQVNNRGRSGLQKIKDYHQGRDYKNQCSDSGGESPVILLQSESNVSTDIQNADIPVFDSTARAFQESSHYSFPSTGNRRHLSGGDYRSNATSVFSPPPSERSKVAPIISDELSKPLLGNGNNMDNKKPDIVDRNRLRPPVFRLPASKRWRSCDEIELPRVTKLSFKDWFAGLFSRVPDVEVRRPVNSSTGVHRPLKQRDKEESLV